MADISPDMLQRLALMLGQRSQPQAQGDSPFWPSRARGRAAMGLMPETRPVNVAATPPALPNFQAPGGMMPEFTNAPRPIQPSGPPPAPPMTATPAMPPPSVAPGDQTMPSNPTQSATAADAGNPIAQAPGFWDRWKMMLPQGQVPQQYRGVMGEQIGNG